MEADVQVREMECLARRYVWWKSVPATLDYISILVAQIMNIGTWEDVCVLQNILGESALLEALQKAEAGMFNARSWNFWHLRFGIFPVPPMPQRRLE